MPSSGLSPVQFFPHWPVTQKLTFRKEKSLVCSIMVISRLPITISQPVYISFIRLYWMSEFPVVLRTFLVPVQTTTGKEKKRNNVLLLMSLMSNDLKHFSLSHTIKHNYL